MRVVSTTVPGGGGGGGELLTGRDGCGDGGREAGGLPDGAGLEDVVAGGSEGSPTVGEGSDVGRAGAGELDVLELEPELDDPVEPDPPVLEPPLVLSARVPDPWSPSPMVGTAMNAASSATNPTSTATARTRTSSTVVPTRAGVA